MPLVLGIDSSIHSTRVEVRDADSGRLVSSGAAPHPAPKATAGSLRSEQSPLAWWDALTTAVQRTGVRDVAALAVTSPPGLVCLDAAGSVLRPAKLWNDGEATRDADRLTKVIPSDRWVRMCGSIPVAGMAVSQVAWLARQFPDQLRQTGRLLAPHDYLTFRLTGRFLTDRGGASTTGYWSPSEGRWVPEVLARVVDGSSTEDWSARLPGVVAPEEPADWVSASIHDQLGLRGRPLVGPGTGTTMATALAVGLEPGQVMLFIDESAAAATVSPRSVADAAGVVAGLADATGRFLPQVPSLNGVPAVEAMAGVLGFDRHQLSAQALTAPPGAGGLVFVPHLDGERSPNRPASSGSLLGIRRDVTPGAVARAVYEGVVCGLLVGVAALRRAGVIVDRGDSGGGGDSSGDGDDDDWTMVLAGAGAAHAAFPQVAADLSGRRVVPAPLPCPAATGACVQAAGLLHERPPAEVAAAWALGSAPPVEPTADVDGAAVLAAYRAAVGAG